MAKYRINGKFASFKSFVKTFGLDAVSYESLSKQERKVWNGINTYQSRAVLSGGKFAPKTLTENPTIRAFAQSRGESLKKYLEDNEADILKFTNQGLINRTVNSKSLHDFIQNHKGDILYRGQSMSKEEFLFKMDMNRAKDASTSTTVETLYNFNVKNNGKTLELRSTKKIKSGKAPAKK